MGLPVGGVYSNSYDDIRTAFGFCADHGLGPSLAIYEPGFLQTTLTYERAGRLPAGSMAKFYFGGEWGLMATGRGEMNCTSTPRSSSRPRWRSWACCMGPSGISRPLPTGVRRAMRL